MSCPRFRKLVNCWMLLDQRILLRYRSETRNIETHWARCTQQWWKNMSWTNSSCLRPFGLSFWHCKQLPFKVCNLIACLHAVCYMKTNSLKFWKFWFLLWFTTLVSYNRLWIYLNHSLDCTDLHICEGYLVNFNQPRLDPLRLNTNCIDMEQWHSYQVHREEYTNLELILEPRDSYFVEQVFQNEFPALDMLAGTLSDR